MSSFSSWSTECHESTATASLSPVPVTWQDPSLTSTSHISFVLWDRLKMAWKNTFLLFYFLQNSKFVCSRHFTSPFFHNSTCHTNCWEGNGDNSSKSSVPWNRISCYLSLVVPLTRHCVGQAPWLAHALSLPPSSVFPTTTWLCMQIGKQATTSNKRRLTRLHRRNRLCWNIGAELVHHAA